MTFNLSGKVFSRKTETKQKRLLTTRKGSRRSGLAEYAYAKPHREIGAEHVKAILEEALDLWPWGNSVAPIRGTSPTVREGSKYAT